MRHGFNYILFLLGICSFDGHSQSISDISSDNTCGLFSPYQIDIEQCLRTEISEESSVLYSPLELMVGNETANRSHPEFFLRIDLTSPANGLQHRPPLNLCLVLDRSASMSEHGRMDKLKIALKEFVMHMTTDDYIAIVAYDDRAEILIPSQRLSDVATIFSKIDAMTPGRATNILAGLLAGYSELRRNYNFGMINRLILMSDGMSTVGETSASEIIRKSRAVSAGVETSTFGLGADINFELMSELARQGRGLSHFIGDCDSISDDLSYAMQNEMTGLKQSMYGVSITLDYPKQLELSSSYGYELESLEPGRAKIKLSDISAGQRQSVFVSLRIKESVRKPIFIKSTLNYFISASKKKQEAVRSTKLYFHRKNTDKIDPLADEYVRSAYLSATLAVELKKSLYMFVSRQYAESLRILDKVYQMLSSEKNLPDNRHFKYLHKMLLIQRAILINKKK
ncbi:MAG: VWA domain-containing protein [Prevotellaceae bacterium]|jgi:Ca-activated chloride channel family protein|nr:VWA domain-containing protein [Prevotellaceae bacterium]